MPQLNRDPLAARSRGPLQQHTPPPGAAQGRRAPPTPKPGLPAGPAHGRGGHGQTWRGPRPSQLWCPVTGLEEPGHLPSSQRAPSLLAYVTSVSPRASAVPKSKGSRPSGGHTGPSLATGAGSRDICPARHAPAGLAGAAPGPGCEVSLNSRACHTPQVRNTVRARLARVPSGLPRRPGGKSPTRETLAQRQESVTPAEVLPASSPPGAHRDCDRSGSAHGPQPPGQGHVPLNHLRDTLSPPFHQQRWWGEGGSQKVTFKL